MKRIIVTLALTGTFLFGSVQAQESTVPNLETVHIEVSTTIGPSIPATSPSETTTRTRKRTGSKRECGSYRGRDYIICKESGPQHMPNGLPTGSSHPGPSSASGPCGFLASTRKVFGPGSLSDCAQYMRVRYGSWSRAEVHHRRHSWW